MYVYLDKTLSKHHTREKNQSQKAQSLHLINLMSMQ